MGSTYKTTIKQKFEEIHHKSPEIMVKAPGRINLIGEHLDYNHGYVLPAAIDKAIYFAVSRNQDKVCRFYAYDLSDSLEISLDCLKKSDKGWANYLIGVLSELINQRFSITTGIDVVFGGDVPLGAGLSSSAAVESGMVFALNQLFDLHLKPFEMALIAQESEHNFAGVNCGIMDMFASIHGKEESVIRLDCRDLTYQYFPFHSTDYQIVLCNTGVKHNLGDSEYNTRRAECEEGVSILQGAYPQIDSLRDATPMMLRSQADKMSDVVYRRCKYVIEEIHRVEVACEALLQDDLITFGQKMYETHDGLQHDYEVSCEELDFLVDICRDDVNVIGSRMMGGGFGGCTINLVKKDYLEQFIKNTEKAYFERFNRKMEHYEVKLTDGVRVL